MRIDDNIELIDNTMCNVYVVRLDDKVIQIDSGMKGNAKVIIEYYEERKIRPDVVLITHYHLDHIGALSIIQKRYNPEIYAHRLEIPVIEGRSSMGKPGSLGARIIFSLIRPEPVKDVRPLEEFKIDKIKILETPGHTPGSTSYIFEKAIFIGDAAGNVNGNLVINEKYTLDMERARESLEKIRRLSPVLVLPGHGKPLSI
ncbi:MAG: MBL fold metallo-hydrolase [Thermoplasmata archaeon]